LPTSFDKARIEAVLEAACKRLDGEWLLLGGALVALWFESRRTTEDLDLVGLRGTADERLQLMTLASELGLPIESVNSAADFFVFAIHDWREHIAVLRSGPRCRIYRPDPTLFVLLKCRRLSEQDLTDCVALIGRCRELEAPLDGLRIRAAIEALPKTRDEDLRRRRDVLLRSLPRDVAKTPRVAKPKPKGAQHGRGRGRSPLRKSR
jgi:hypothetical protein